MASPLARTGKPVSTVARLCQGVGSETQPNLSLNDVVNDLGVLAGVKVIDELGALVTKEAGVLEPNGTFHVHELTLHP